MIGGILCVSYLSICLPVYLFSTLKLSLTFELEEIETVYLA